jgi:hypothetical protein
MAWWPNQGTRRTCATAVALAQAFPVRPPVKYGIYPWNATVIQGQQDSFEGVYQLETPAYLGCESFISSW